MSSNWDLRYLGLAREVASWSKDPSSKIGAIAVGAKGQVLAQGYNGFPRGINDSEARLNTRELKYKYIVHAEQNVIYNATYNGVSLDKATLYVYGLPVCSACALGVIQVGIRRIVMPNMEYKKEWMDNFLGGSKHMFDEADVKWEFVNVPDNWNQPI